MKLLILLHIFWCCTVQVLTAVDYAKVAADIHYEIGIMLVDFNVFQFNVDKSLNDPKPIDFGIKNDSQIKDLQKMIDKKLGKPGIQDCQSKLDVAIHNLDENLQNIVKTKLIEKSQYLKQYVANLTNIQNNLIGTKLQKEVAACVNPKCNLRKEYNNTRMNARNFIKDNKAELTSKELPRVYGEKYALPGMSHKINSAIAPKIMMCLGEIK